MKVSVVVVSSNRKDLVADTLEALFKQNYPKQDYDIILVDDGSTDGTREMVQSLMKENRNLRYIFIGKSGVGIARNTGAKNATGSIVACVDSDCIPDKDWLLFITAPFADKAVVGVEGKTTSDKTRRLFYNAPENLTGGKYITCNIAYRKELFEKIGYFEPSFKYWREDTEFAIRALKVGKIFFEPRAIVFHRPIRVSFFRPLQNLKCSRNDLVVYRRFPKEYIRLLGFPFKNEIINSLLSYLFLLSSVLLLLLNQFIVLIPFFLAVFLIRYLISLRNKKFSIADFFAYQVMTEISGLLFPLYLVYYYMDILLSGKK